MFPRGCNFHSCCLVCVASDSDTDGTPHGKLKLNVTATTILKNKDK